MGRTRPPLFDFAMFGITEGARLDVTFKNNGVYPSACAGVVEKVYPAFALIKTTAGYRTTIHQGELATGQAIVSVKQAKKAV